MGKIKLAVLDDYQQVALTSADWTPILAGCEVSVFHDHIDDVPALVRRLEPFEILCVMRERTPLPRALLEQLPNLRFIASTGARNASIDLKAAEDLDIEVAYTGYTSTAAIELTWALILAAARHLPQEISSVQTGGWQTRLGQELKGKTLGLIGLGRIGSAIAKIGNAFGMRVLAWSQNLTPDRAAESGAAWVPRETLFGDADFVSLHLILSKRTQQLIGETDFDRMKQSAWFVNTARAGIVDEHALMNHLKLRKISGAALDVFWNEPLSLQSPWRKLENVLSSPHIGFVTDEAYKTFYGDCARNVLAYLHGKELRP